MKLSKVWGYSIIGFNSLTTDLQRLVCTLRVKNMAIFRDGLPTEVCFISSAYFLSLLEMKPI